MTRLISTPEVIAVAAHNTLDYMFTSLDGTMFGARWNHSSGETQLRGNAEHTLAYHLSGNTDVERRNGGRVTGLRSKVGSVTFMPRNSESVWRLGSLKFLKGRKTGNSAT
ncbi:MAG: hypothetical protein NTY41_08380 [Proteobacteria bacterium]|nr:hypothetical protein [Pseudomonadota bacterium]